MFFRSYQKFQKCFRQFFCREHATKVLEGLRENPVVAVPQVLKRLREKDTEWRSVREEFNSIWRDQIDKNYLKSLDHQAITFKANDLKFLRSKAIIQQLESFYDEVIFCDIFMLIHLPF